jgi:hypothetical protein
MLVEMNVPYCDITGEHFPWIVSGGGYIARGATGRWCVVMYAGPKEVERHVAAGGKLMTMDEAYSYIDDIGGVDWADF